jgi:CRP/FNR family transcriptional regulator, cyclic AMP receptor protein
MVSAVPVGPDADVAFDIAGFLDKIGAGKAITQVRQDDVIFTQGDSATSIYFIQQGKVKLTVMSKHGKEAIVGVLEAGQFFGESCLHGSTKRLATTTALEDSVVISISRPLMLAALKDEPKFNARFISYLLSRNTRIEEDLIDQLFNSSERRLARLLLLLAHFGKEGTAQPIDVDISREALADMIGTTPSRISHFMDKFQRLGFISANGKIHVHHALLNAVLHEKPALRADDDA